MLNSFEWTIKSYLEKLDFFSNEDVLSQYHSELIKQKTLGKNMTVILAGRECDDSILVGADSLQIDATSNRKTIIKKLYELKNYRIVWGYSGCSELAYKFERRLKEPDPAICSWDTFEKDIREIIVDINAEQRYYVKRSGANWNSNLGLSCLFAGWLGGEPHMITIEDDSTIGDYLPQGIGGIGSGYPPAMAAYEALEEIKDISVGKRFYIALKTAINIERLYCGLPLVIWRITPEKVLDITKEFTT